MIYMIYIELTVNYAQLTELRLFTSLRRLSKIKRAPINCAQLVMLSTQLPVHLLYYTTELNLFSHTVTHHSTGIKQNSS